MLSTPQESTRFSSPEPTSPAARVLACWLDPHWLSTVVAPTSRGRPAESHAVRTTLKACSPTWDTQPPTTWSTAPASTPARSTAARSTRPSRSAGCSVDSPPPRRPRGERTASRM